MVSIKSENKRRQRIFKECKVNNINDYTRLFNSGSVNEPIPHLLIIIDEFAELKKAEPEFMQELISVAQVGRSLGVHLLLATQKPGGVVDDKIWSNSRFRICLKVQEREDSMDMLHNMDACQITQTGRGYLQVGNNEVYELFQAGWSGALFQQEDTEVAACLVQTDGTIYKRRKNAEKNREKKDNTIAGNQTVYYTFCKRKGISRGKKIMAGTIVEVYIFR
ncbi:FtsK/SpoIIIE domain-containing protein [Anaerobutyricum hallii]|nr:FtsK/SpoIIIE domain-containing protein [Anaerobutyricum hallii]